MEPAEVLIVACVATLVAFITNSVFKARRIKYYDPYLVRVNMSVVPQGSQSETRKLDVRELPNRMRVTVEDLRRVAEEKLRKEPRMAGRRPPSILSSIIDISSTLCSGVCLIIFRSEEAKIAFTKWFGGLYVEGWVSNYRSVS